MKAISALTNIHTHGLFGDYQGKNKNDLVTISEPEKLQIIQIVHYRKSSLRVSSLKIMNLNFPLIPMQVISNNDTRILWSAPDSWLLVSTKKNILNLVKNVCDEKNFAITNLSDSRAIIEIKGKDSKEILKKGCPINLNEFKLNNCANSVFHNVAITIDMINDNPETFRIFSLRSFGESFYHHITDAALEFGYNGV